MAYMSCDYIAVGNFGTVKLLISWDPVTICRPSIGNTYFLECMNKEKKDGEVGSGFVHVNLLN